MGSLTLASQSYFKDMLLVGSAPNIAHNQAQVFWPIWFMGLFGSIRCRACPIPHREPSEALLLNYFDAPIDNGIVEGLSNKVKVIIHKAYGFKTATN